MMKQDFLLDDSNKKTCYNIFKRWNMKFEEIKIDNESEDAEYDIYDLEGLDELYDDDEIDFAELNFLKGYHQSA